MTNGPQLGGAAAAVIAVGIFAVVALADVVTPLDVNPAVLQVVALVVAAWTRSQRLLWTLAWLAFLVHLAVSLHFFHHWSHAHVVRHTQESSGFGEGVYVSHLFTLAWTLDVLWWWLRPASYARRSPWVDRVLHAFMAFIIFCGTVVYETGFIRWAGLAMFVILGAAFAHPRLTAEA